MAMLYISVVKVLYFLPLSIVSCEILISFQEQVKMNPIRNFCSRGHRIAKNLTYKHDCTI